MNNEIPSSTMYEKLLVTSQAVICTKLGGLRVLPIANILWIYTIVTVGKLEFIIPIYKITSLIFACRNRKKYEIRIKNNGKAFQFIQSELLRYRLDLVFGTEYGMDKIYKEDINRMIAFSQECAEKRQKQLEEGQQL